MTFSFRTTLKLTLAAVILLISSIPLAQASTTPGSWEEANKSLAPRRWYRFLEESMMTAQDSGTDGLPLTFFGIVTPGTFPFVGDIDTSTSIQIGNDDTYGYGLIPTIDLSNHSWSISAFASTIPWIGDDQKTILSFKDGRSLMTLWMTSGGELGVGFPGRSNGFITTAPFLPFSTEVAHSFVVTYDSGLKYLSIYVDGALKVTRLILSPYPGQAPEIRLGQDSDGKNRFFGTIGEVRIWDRALTAKDVTSLHTAASAQGI